MYDLIIIGGGPAGLSAGIYARRYGINFLVIGQIKGGTVNEAHIVDNYLGFKSISGPDLAKKFYEHFNAKTKNEQVVKLTKSGVKSPIFEVVTDKGRYQAKSLILGLGMKMRKLGIKNEDKFLNKGISYCAPDISTLKNKTVAVVGGGDSALTLVLKVSDYAKKAYIILRRDEFRGAPSLVKKAEKKENIEILYCAQVAEAKGKKSLEKIILNNGNEVKLNELFIEVGGVPNVHLCGELKIEMDNNFIAVNKEQATNVPGVFAAGDITNNPLKQIITACAEGAVAATGVYKYLRNVKE
ncbi:NAD(P)/FAD-dependent oxidoreductase [Patescibacteria group bacterium]|nr:NAD(P)/FAD-dependent oxidoreductase [Patescibacteria group bacterium]